jgi:uncharacterized membrane protein YdcZ (DUF606 family)
VLCTFSPATRQASTRRKPLYAAVGGVATGVVVLGAGALYSAVGGDAYFAMSALAAMGAALALGAERPAPVKS